MKVLSVTLVILFIPAFALAQSKRVPRVVLPDINGHSFSLSDYRGKVVLLNFWATWCPPCRTEIPDLIKLQRQYRNKGLRVVGITNPPETLSQIRRFARRQKINYPVVIGTKTTKTLFTTSETLPVTVIVDREGVVREIIEGIMYSDEFDAKVKPLLSVQR
jgi:thiol-disulfide isomerase/thioredoxin